MLLAALGLSLIAFTALVAYVATGAAAWLWVLFPSAAAGLGALGADIWRRGR